MSDSIDHQWRRLAVLGAVAAALTLAGCGRKGPLDPPPIAAVPGQTDGADQAPGQAAPAPQPVPGITQPAQRQAGIGPGGSAAPVAPPPSGRNQRFFLDWLLN